MAAFVVAPDTPADARRTGVQLNVFPGSATPTVFSARTPFWVGCGFVPAPSGSNPEGRMSLDGSTRFELTVDGEPAAVEVDDELDGKRTVSKLAYASFAAGLAPGWHRFAARWYVSGRLVLTSDTSIEFVEP
jgi:hypothetical protein